MNKAVIIGIVVSVIILGILAISLLDSSSSIMEDNEEQKSQFLETEEDEKKPQGRDLSIELGEKMGLSAP